MSMDIKNILRLKSLVLFVVVILFCAYNMVPKLREANHYRAKIRSAQMAIEKLTDAEIAEQLNKFEEELNYLKEGFANLKKATNEAQQKVKQEKNIALVTLEVEDLANASQIELDSVKPLNSEPREGFEVQLIEIGFQGGYADLTRFLSQIENASAFMAVQNLSVRKNSLTPETLDINLIINVLFSHSELDSQSGGMKK